MNIRCDKVVHAIHCCHMNAIPESENPRIDVDYTSIDRCLIDVDHRLVAVLDGVYIQRQVVIQTTSKKYQSSALLARCDGNPPVIGGIP